jgi:hypothetical protein
VPGPDKTTPAGQLAAELRIPLFSQDVIAPSVADALWALLRDSPVGGVVESWFLPDDALFVVEGLPRCGLDPATVPEVWCLPAQVGVGAAAGTGTDGGCRYRPRCSARRRRSDRLQVGVPASET